MPEDDRTRAMVTDLMDNTAKDDKALLEVQSIVSFREDSPLPQPSMVDDIDVESIRKLLNAYNDKAPDRYYREYFQIMLEHLVKPTWYKIDLHYGKGPFL